MHWGILCRTQHYKSVHPQVTFLVITTVVVWRRQTRLKTRRPPSNNGRRPHTQFSIKSADQVSSPRCGLRGRCELDATSSRHRAKTRRRSRRRCSHGYILFWYERRCANNCRANNTARPMDCLHAQNPSSRQLFAQWIVCTRANNPKCHTIAS